MAANRPTTVQDLIDLLEQMPRHRPVVLRGTEVVTVWDKGDWTGQDGPAVIVGDPDAPLGCSGCDGAY